MKRFGFRSALPSALALALVAAAHAQSQCSAWSDGFALPGVAGTVLDAVVFDDGSGPKLYVGGDFSNAGSRPASNLASWDGVQWAAVGGGVGGPGAFGTGSVSALAVHDDGSGAALYVGGTFTTAGGAVAQNLARWNGASWSTIGGASSTIETFHSFDDGSGPKLYAGGAFGQIGGVNALRVAVWNGSTWAAFGGGISATSGSPTVRALASFDEGAGPRLFAAGFFNRVDGSTPVSSLARWDGSSWSDVGATVSHSSNVADLHVHDDGTGAALYVGGYSSPGIARWNGSTWSSVGSAPFARARALRTFDFGAGPTLVAADDTVVRQWNGAVWSTVGDSLTLAGAPALTHVEALCDYAAPGGGSRLFALGDLRLSSTGVPLGNVAQLVGAIWLPTGDEDGLPADVEVLCSTENGPDGRALYVGGLFLGSSLPSPLIARWDGSQWRALGAGMRTGFDNYEIPQVRALVVHDDGSGPLLYAGGDFRYADNLLVNGVARWDGVTWSALGAGFDATVNALAIFDDGSGPQLYAAGEFGLSGGVAVGRIAKWNGAAWEPVGGGTSGAEINALAVYDYGSGPQLYAAGAFGSLGGAATSFIGRWDGVAWSGLAGSDLDARANSLAVFEGELYVGGQFSEANGVSSTNIARWNGTSWSDVGGEGADHYVFAMCEFDDGGGGGPALFAAGRFQHVSGVTAARIAKWDGTSWFATGALDVTVNALAAFDDPSTPWRELYAGGRFLNADGRPAAHIARFSNPCACQASAYCTAGTTSSGCVPSISGIGTPSASAASGFMIRIDGVEGQKQGHIAYSVTGPLANPWSPLSSSFLCIKAPTQRTPTQNSGGTSGGCDGVMQLDWLDYVATHPTALAAPYSAGAQVWAQLYFRDPPAAKTTNLSNGLRFQVCP